MDRQIGRYIHRYIGRANKSNCQQLLNLDGKHTAIILVFQLFYNFEIFPDKKL